MLTVQRGNQGDAAPRKRRNAADTAHTEQDSHVLIETTAGVVRPTVRSVLKLVRAAQPVSRADLARRLGINRSTVTEIVKPLLAQGTLREEAAQITRRVGRPPVGLSLQSADEFFIGVNIGVRQSQVGAATADGETLSVEVFDTPADASATLDAAGDLIRRVTRATSGRALLGIGVSVPGPVNTDRTRLMQAPHLGWHDVEIARALSSAVAGESSGENFVVVENDATAAATYEMHRRWKHASTLIEDFVLVRAGTGIGVGLVVGGEVFRGSARHGALTGEFGHMTIVANGRTCACGNRGCWERYASARSAAALYAGDRFNPRGGRAPHFAELVSRAEAGEVRARRTLEQMGEYLGIGIANVITGVGIGHVIVSGRVVLGWEFVRDPVHEAVARTMAGKLTRWTVEAGEASGAGLGGAIEVAIEHHLTRIAESVRVAA